MKSKFIVLVGPSGCGKTTIMQELVKQHPEIKYARSITMMTCIALSQKKIS